ncbi:YhaI family protein [Lederbergia sp. NSJ-179]|uniref:DUF1878 family protein n=1 Tax=Lederbergia sp. NSJ-179 TaxID=2931402 RepID=UPI001FCFCA40|nr:DUF1878 family protein [Lederbergia sp. NSJ-179]MCJ7840421.1 YhaI family protein [Lederbergia sp. NSJ-179]
MSAYQDKDGVLIMDQLLARIKKLEYHQKLLLNMIHGEGFEFDRLIVVNNLDQNEVEEFLKMCEDLNKEMLEQKAEKFIFYAPLFAEFKHRLTPKLDHREVIEACLRQQIYPELMEKLKRNILD